MTESITIPPTEAPVQVAVPVSSQVLRDALTATLLAAGPANSVPVLHAVQIELVGDELVFRSTDRYRLARVTVTLTKRAESTWKVLVPVADCKQIISALPKKGWPEDTTLELVDDLLEVKVQDGALLRLRPLDGDYPNTDAVIPTSSKATETFGFRANQLADLARMPGLRKEPVVFKFNGADKAAIAEWTVGASAYLYMVMPMRQSA